MVIRKASFHEAKEILNYSLIILEEATMGFVKGNKDTAPQMMTQVLNDGGYYLVYEENQMITGWLGVGFNYNIITREMDGVLVELYVLPKYRKKGIAEKLMVHAIERLKEKGLKKVLLNVYAGNPAKQLYDKLGFYDVSTIMEINL